MKQKFSKSWISSLQPRKQVKYRKNAPHHLRRKFLSALLDKPLRNKQGTRNVKLRKGDEVKIMRGSFKGKMGKVSKIDLKNSRIQIDGVQRSKAGGEKLETWFVPSKVKIIQLDLSDNKRFKKTKDLETKQKPKISEEKAKASESKADSSKDVKKVKKQ